MLQKLLEQKPYLAWYIKDKTKLSDESSLEHILNYGDWEDVQKARKAVGISQMKLLFEHLCSKKRINLKPYTIQYFKKYFAKYA